MQFNRNGTTEKSVWFLVTETHRGQQLTPALTLPQVRYGLSVLLLEVFCTLSIASICRHVQRQCMHNELARFSHRMAPRVTRWDHHRTRNGLPRKN